MTLSSAKPEDHGRATRLQRQLMGLMSYLMFLVPLLYASQQGWLRLDYLGVLVFLVVALVTNLGFYLAVRRDWTRRFADPSLLSLQMVIANLMALVIGYLLLPEAMAISLMLIFTAFFFGLFSFGMRKYLAHGAALALGYAAMLALKYAPAQMAGADFRLELLHLMVLVIVLLWMSLLGSYIGRLRSGLAEQKDALARALARLEELASRDELTGLHNRRHLMEVLEQQQERSRRHGEPFSLCILDLDHFKRINDAHGHGVGDEVLRGFSERVRAQLRKMDVIGHGESDSTFGRYGGEEFLLLLPYTHDGAALACVQRLHGAVRDQPIPTSAGPLGLTFSAGIAEYRPGESSAQVIHRADAALYRAKSAGRDRVASAP